MVARSLIVGCGSYLPQNVVTNADLAKRIDTSDEWIVARTGIRERRLAAPDETTADLAARAAEAALDEAGMPAADLDFLVLATTIPDHTFPATAAKVQARIGMTRGAAFDVQAVCTGFIYALAVADNFLTTGQGGSALVIGAETFSRILDWDDRTTCVLFGDGAGAVVLARTEGAGTIADRGVLSTHLHSDGSQHGILYTDGGPSLTQTTGVIRMAGREVFRQAVQRQAEVVDEVLATHGLAADDIDWLVPHQANRRIIEATGRKLGMPSEKVIVTIDRHANTSAASIPLALGEAVGADSIKRNELVLLVAMGGGVTWGAALVRM